MLQSMKIALSLANSTDTDEMLHNGIILSGSMLFVNVIMILGRLVHRILGECHLISSLPGKALRTLVDIARLAERFNMRSQS